MTVGSPINDLIQAFQDFLRDNQFKIDINQKDYDVQLAEHNQWEAAIRERIAVAETGIATSTSTLENVLYPLKASLAAQIQRDRELDAETVAAMELAEAERVQNNNNHVLFVEECQAAIDAINDCLELLEGLDSGAASLVQVTKVERSFKKISASLKNTRHSSMVKALLKLADFANPEMLARLQDKFIAVRESLMQDIENSRQEEEDQNANHGIFMGVSQDTLDECRQRVAENTQQAEENDAAIAETEAFREECRADLAVAQADLEFELNRWANVVALFEKMMAELQNEQDAIYEVIDICSSIDVSEETFERMNQ